MPIIIWVAAACVASAIPIGWWAVSGDDSGKNARQNLRSGGSNHDYRTLRLGLSAQDRLWSPVRYYVVTAARRITPAGMLDRTQRAIHLAGVGSDWTMERMLALKAILVLVAALFGMLRFAAEPTMRNLLMALTIMISAWIFPDVILRRRAETRQDDIQRALPDVMDQVMINVEAGQTFEAAMARVSARGKGAAAEEFRRVMQDIQLGMSRSQALEQLTDRTDVPDLRELVQALNQSEKYGVPLGNVLRTQAEELRSKRRDRAEERALKVPVKLLFPMMFCMLPAIFVIILGPGIVGILQNGVG